MAQTMPQRKERLVFLINNYHMILNIIDVSHFHLIYVVVIDRSSSVLFVVKRCFSGKSRAR